MKITVSLFVLGAFLANAPLHAQNFACPEAADPMAVTSIREQRERFNEAIASKNDQVIGTILHEDVILVTGTDSDLFENREAQVAIWQDDFGREDRAIYVRNPGCIRVSGMAPVALEFGTWRGERIDDASAFATGSYSAKWRQTEGRWLLEGELFATEACGGSFCP